MGWAAKARAEHPHDEMLAFRIFNWDCGVLLHSRLYHERVEPTDEELGAIDRLKGKSLWELRPRQRTSKVIDENTDTPEMLELRRTEERQDRAAQLAALSDAKMMELELAGKSVTDALAPPLYVPKIDDEN